eukprot:scaffold244_cov172-Amphora_coffeaeformis.AAC.50
MAFLTYLMTFKSHHAQRHTKFWARGLLHSMAGLFLYTGAFCAIPAVGSAFARMVGVDEEGEGSEEGNSSNEPVSSGLLLCYAVVAFMVFTALMNLIKKDP